MTTKTTPPADEALLPCPFCGVSATINKSSSKAKGYIVICDCFECQTIKTGGTRTAAIHKWNTRTPPPPDPDLIALREENARFREALVKIKDLEEADTERPKSPFTFETVAMLAWDYSRHALRSQPKAEGE